MGKRYDDILATIGRTPVVRVHSLAPAGINLFVKIEAFNPMGSVKDRLALGVIEDAERTGKLRPGQTVIEATSGNTGIGLAMVCARKGYPLVVTMAENFSVERRKMMRFLGAKVVLTPAAEKGSGMLAKAVELAEKHGWFLCRQFENEANPNMHSRTTAEEILADFADIGLDYWVTGYGTGGTLKGVARVLKARSPRTQIVVCEPDNSQMLGSGIPQPRPADGTPASSHPLFRPHLMQGWAPDFIPKLTEDAVAAKLIDRIVPVNGGEAMRLARELARKEGIFIGTSSGATFAGALEVCKSAPPGANVLCMLPDTGERYLEHAAVRRHPGRHDRRGARDRALDAALPVRRAAPREGSRAAEGGRSRCRPLRRRPRRSSRRSSSDKSQPVVMFALEWCEFCWSVRRMFAECRIPYRAVDLDSVAVPARRLGRTDPRARSRRAPTWKTIPQIFVGGEFIGGATDTFDAWKNGRLPALLAKHGVAHSGKLDGNPYSFLPTWLHPR